ncbi:MAG TPA: gas vesicle protein [Nocardioidaceae bacterium]|nr:gas vesicle protein [Nocardioidaceae bacterium]
MATTKKAASSSTAKKSTAKKSTAKKTAARKAPARKTAAAKKTTAAKKTAAKRTTTARRTAEPDTSTQDEQREPAARSRPRKAMDIARSAAQQLAELTGREPETVIGIKRTEDGWQVDLEVVESRRIPDSTDILATYEVEVDEDGDLTGYHRARRYVRGKGGEGEGGR